MKIGIIGAGAIGCWIAAKLARSGHQVSILARGQTLSNLREHGVRLNSANGNFQERVFASNIAKDLGPQDIVILAVKSHSLSLVSQACAIMINENSIIIPAMNGVPWWFLEGAQEHLKSRTLTSVDPEGICRDNIPIDQVLGCVVHAAVHSIEPGHVQHVLGNGLIVGSANNQTKKRVGSIANMLNTADITTKFSDNIRQDIWYKLLGNMTINPLSAISGATCDVILDDPDVKAFATDIMQEATLIGAAIGCPITESPKDYLKATRELGAFKTSMLQDVEAGRRLEIGALLAAPQEIARMAGISTPTLDHLSGLMRIFELSR